jgi:MFS family permease
MGLIHHEFRPGWRPLTAATIGAGCGITSIPFYTHGVFVLPIAAEMGWTRGATQFAFTLLMLSAIVCAPLMGMLLDRFGARRVGLVSIPLLGLTFAGLSLATPQIWTYYAAWLVMAVLAAGTLPVTWTRAVTTWFDEKRGLALGITMSGTGIAATIAPVVAAALIANYGWQDAYRALGLIIVLIGLPVVALWFREASQADLRGSTPRVLSGITLREAARLPRFWILALSLLFVSTGIAGVISNLVPLLIDRGFDGPVAARYAGLIGIAVIFGRLVTGYLIDRIWAPLIAAIFLSAPAVACLLLASGSPVEFWIGLAAFLIGFAAGAELDLIAYLTSRYFGLKYYGAIYGAQFAFFAMGAGLGPPMFGFVFDFTASYTPILLVSAVLFFVGGMILLLMGPYPGDDREGAPAAG